MASVGTSNSNTNNLLLAVLSSATQRQQPHLLTSTIPGLSSSMVTAAVGSAAPFSQVDDDDSILREPTTSDHILLGICFIVGVLGIIGNAVMVVSIVVVRSFRQASNIFFFHHGVLEVAKSALIIPYALSITGKRASYCELLGAMQCVLVTTTSLNLAAITINQSFIISHTLPGASASMDEQDNHGTDRVTSHSTNIAMSSQHQGGRNEQMKQQQKQQNANTIRVISALEAGSLHKPSLKRNITCVVFGVLLIWMASLVLNMGVSLITGSGQYNEKIGLCYFVYGHQKSYVVNVMWIVVTSLGVGATIGCLRKLKLDLRRSQQYLMRTFPNSFRSARSRSLPASRHNSSDGDGPRNNNHKSNTISDPSKPSSTIDKLSSANKKGYPNNKKATKVTSSSEKLPPRSATIDERQQARINAMLSKQAFQQTRLLNCQFNVIVLQTISFIIFWYPLFGLIIADKDFMVDTEIYKALTVLAWLNAPLTPVFFTYFNYECYSSHVSVRLSVVGNATAQVVREQAIIADKLGKNGNDEYEDAEDEDYNDDDDGSIHGRDRKPMKREIVDKKLKSAVRTTESSRPTKKVMTQPRAGRSLHDLNDISPSSPHQLPQGWMSAKSLRQLAMSRTETFPLETDIDLEAVEPSKSWTATTSRSLRDLQQLPSNQLKIGVSGLPVRMPIPPPTTQKKGVVLFSNTSKQQKGQNDICHSYENIASFSTLPKESQQESLKQKQTKQARIPHSHTSHGPITSWHRLTNEVDDENAVEDNKPAAVMSTWLQLAASGGGAKTPVTNNGASVRKISGTGMTVSSSEDDFKFVNRRPMQQQSGHKSRLAIAKKLSMEQSNSATRMVTSSSMTATSSTDAEGSTPTVHYGSSTLKAHREAFRNPVYIEAFKRANLNIGGKRQSATKDDDDSADQDLSTNEQPLLERSIVKPKPRLAKKGQVPRSQQFDDTEEESIRDITTLENVAIFGKMSNSNKDNNCDFTGEDDEEDAEIANIANEEEQDDDEEEAGDEDSSHRPFVEVHVRPSDSSERLQIWLAGNKSPVTQEKTKKPSLINEFQSRHAKSATLDSATSSGESPKRTVTIQMTQSNKLSAQASSDTSDHREIWI